MDPHCGRKFCTISRCVLSNFISYCYARWSLGSCSAWQGVSLPIVIDVPIPTLDHCPFFWLSRRFFNESCRSKRSAVVLMTGHFPVVKMFIAIPFPSCIMLHLPKHGENSRNPWLPRNALPFGSLGAKKLFDWHPNFQPGRGFSPIPKILPFLLIGGKKNSISER